MIIGGGQVGLEVAEYLAEKGKRITVIEILDELARGMPDVAKLPLLNRLEELGVAIWTKANVKEIQDREVIIQWKGLEKRVSANTVIIAVGSESNKEFLGQIKIEFLKPILSGIFPNREEFLRPFKRDSK